MNYHRVLSKMNITILMFVIVNFLFCIKYLSRLSDYYLVLSCAFSLLHIFFIPLIYKVVTKHASRLDVINFLLILIFLIGSLMSWKIVDVNTLDVDRWSVISSFWDVVFAGDYGYYAKSNVGNEPGPMPFYFILALPFYLLGELGYFSFAGIVAFYFLMRSAIFTKARQSLGLILIMSSVFYVWEIVCRSNIFLNGTIVLFAVVLILKIEKFTTIRIILSGILIGLVVSTRNVYVIPFIIAFLFKINHDKMKFVHVIAIGIVAFLSFAMSFLPFVIGHFNDFFVMNPFIIQSSFLIPFQYTLGFLAIAIFFGFYCKSIMDVYFFSAVTLFLSISVYFIYHIFVSGFELTFFGSMADISYFILCVPFAVFYFILNEDLGNKKGSKILVDSGN